MYHIRFDLAFAFVMISPVLAIWLSSLIGWEGEIRIFGNCMYISGCGVKKKKAKFLKFEVRGVIMPMSAIIKNIFFFSLLNVTYTSAIRKNIYFAFGIRCNSYIRNYKKYAYFVLVVWRNAYIRNYKEYQYFVFEVQHNAYIPNYKEYANFVLAIWRNAYIRNYKEY